MSDHPALRNVPNALTVLRLCAVPLFCALMVAAEGPTLAAGIVFVVAAFTDFFDGWIARRAGVMSRFGKIADPLADRLLVGSAAVLESIYDPRMPSWAFVIVVWRDALAVYGFVRARQRVLPTVSMTGKTATALLMAGLAGLLVLPGPRWPLLLFWSGASLSIIALVQYVARYRWVLDDASAPGPADPHVDAGGDGGDEPPATGPDGGVNQVVGAGCVGTERDVYSDGSTTVANPTSGDDQRGKPS